ncbi:hypothetical secreted protein [Sorangium cellulosum So ce56]|uniref:Hypothetical secreted protein n=1 Tax=Sorangium cellulosum (strain So ce56) TaxID=448385 RepID=A9FK67_SORC5|nr:hypothetical protein [Sorangium cellulosum]CAN95086.1 hypothetical secreted protein [Sorangium cellulosum So ce56]
MMASRLALLPLPLLVASCGPTAGSAPAALAPAWVAIPPAPQEALARVAGAPAVDPSAPLTLPIAAMPPPATWVEPPLGEQERARAGRDPFREHTEIALGEHVAIFAAKGGGADPAGGPFAVDEKLGVVGPLKLPARFTWVGVAGQQIDALYAATPEGALHRAAGVRDALRADGFEPRGSVPGATAWDAAGPLIAAAAGERVSVSADEGRTFTSAVVAPGKAVRAVLVRPDGVLAAVVQAPARGQQPAAPDTFLSLDRGQTWKRSAFQPRAIERAGSWIWNGDASCPAVLSRDGRAWTRTAAASLYTTSLYARPTLGIALHLSPTIRAIEAGWFRSSVAPPAPEPPRRGDAAVGREPRCKSDDGGVVGGIGLMGAAGVSCGGALCLLESAAPRPPPTRTQIAAFGDGICEPTSVRPSGSDCAGHLTRPPTFAVVDHIASTVTPVAAPEGCPQPVALHNAAGIGVLICRVGSGGAALFVRGAQGAWHAEGSQATPAEALEWIAAAPDGTLLLIEPTPPASARQREPLQALVRSPLPLGAPQAWRRITAPDGVAALPAPGGAALLASSPAASAGRRLDVTLDRPGQPALTLARDVEVYQDLTLMEMRDGQVRFRVRPNPAPDVKGRLGPPPPEPRDPRGHVLTHGGELVLETPTGPTPPTEGRRLDPGGR